jgi:hypothetical protein
MQYNPGASLSLSQGHCCAVPAGSLTFHEEVQSPQGCALCQVSPTLEQVKRVLSPDPNNIQALIHTSRET